MYLGIDVPIASITCVGTSPKYYFVVAPLQKEFQLNVYFKLNNNRYTI